MLVLTLDSWVVPAYTMAPHSEKLKLMRVVVREDFSKSRCDILVKDIKASLEMLQKLDAAGVDQYAKYVFIVLLLTGSID